jgi:hypothetical protein
MADWQKKIPGCFGAVDHKVDRTRAFELLNDLVKHNVTRSQVQAAFKAYLESRTKDQNYIETKMSTVRTIFAPWLEPG